MTRRLLIRSAAITLEVYAAEFSFPASDYGHKIIDVFFKDGLKSSLSMHDTLEFYDFCRDFEHHAEW